MISHKRILRQEDGVVLVETAFRGTFGGSPSSVVYSVSNKRSARMVSFDDLASATEHFEEELARYERVPRFAASAWRVTG
jgi:hypothetical protein